MADFTRSVELIFGGKDNVTPTVKNITRSLDDFEGRIGSLASPIGDFADSILTVDAALVAVGAAMVAFATGEAIQFESAQLDLQKVLGDTEGDVSQYTGTIRDLSVEYGVMATETTSSVADFKQANFSISDSLTLVESSLIAVKISELDAAQASEFLKTTLIGFNLTAEDSVDVLDTWNEASNNFNTNVGELASGLSEVAPVAEKLGLSLDETAALLVPIIERGNSGSEAAKALRTGFLSLTKETASTSLALEQLGVSQTDSNGAMRNGADILRDVQAAYGNLSDDQQVANAGLLVGKEQALRLIPVLAGASRELEVQAVLANKAGSAMDELAVRMKATEVAVDRMKVAFAAAQKSIGDNFLVGVKGSSDALKELFLSIADVVDSGGLAPLFELMEPLFQGFQDDIAAIAENLPQAFANLDFTGLVSAFQNLGGDLANILTGLFGDFDIETVEGLEAVLQGTIDGLESLINVTRGIFIELQPIFESIGQVIRSTGQIGEDTEIAFGRFLGAGKLINDFGVTLGGALLLIKETGTQVSNVFDVVIGSAQFFINSLQVAFDVLALAVNETLRQLAVAASTFTFGDVSDNFAQIADELYISGQAIQDNLTRNATEARDGLSRIGDGLTNASDEIQTETRKINESVGTVETFAKDAATGLDLIGGELGQVWIDAKTAIDPVTFEITQLAETTSKAGDAAEESSQKTNSWVKSIEGGVVSYTQAAGSISTSNKEIGDSAEEAKQKSDEFLIKMEEIASNERIASIEANVELNIAQLEADTQIAVSIIEGLSESISGTSSLIGELFGQIDGSSRSQELAIESQIRKENERRDNELALQQRLVEAQIDNIEAKTNALREGNGLITITADGLEPELEAFMMAVLDRVQIKAAEDQSLYLLGLPSP